MERFERVGAAVSGPALGDLSLSTLRKTLDPAHAYFTTHTQTLDPAGY